MLGDNKPIILEGIDAIIFRARMEYHNKYPETLAIKQWSIREGIKSMKVIKHKGYETITKNKNYIPLTEVQKKERIKLEAKGDELENLWIYNYIKTNYPDKDYAEQFADMEDLKIIDRDIDALIKEFIAENKNLIEELSWKNIMNKKGK